ncbi:glycosyltransferase family 2 protein [bacterium]|nr:MAG: glycosyltransferase family 2 protein [bacterium]
MVKSISLVFPMYNEREYIAHTIFKAKTVLEKITPDFEIIIVDDASNDGSGGILDELVREDPRIKAVHHLRNRRLGGALKSAFSFASKEIVIYSDIDNPFDLSLLTDFIKLISDVDIVIGYRVGIRESFRKLAYSKVYNWLIRKIYRLNLRDINFSMKIFRKNALDRFCLKSEGSFISAEALAKANYLGYKIKEVAVPYSCRKYGCSRLTTLPVVIKIIFEMVKFYPEIISFKKRKQNAASQF